MQPNLSLLTPDLIARILDEAFQLMMNPGIKVQSAEAIRTLQNAGATVDESTEVVHIPEKLVRQALGSANRDPEVFSSPEKFDPWRKEKEFLTFGHGLHFCLGSHLARREMEVSLKVLSERLPDLQIVEPEQVSITGTVLRGPKSLPVRFARR